MKSYKGDPSRHFIALRRPGFVSLRDTVRSEPGALLTVACELGSEPSSRTGTAPARMLS